MDFVIEDSVKRLGVQVVYLVLHNINNRYYDEQLKSIYNQYYQSLLQSDSYQSITHHPHIIGYRDLHALVKLNNAKLIASPESIFKVLFEKGKLMNINFLVDTYNYISLVNKISIGAHDLSNIVEDVSLKFTMGDEKFIALGSDQAVPVSSGEYCYFDASGDIICRLDCKQCNKTKITNKTKSCLVVFQGNKNIQLGVLMSAAEQLTDLLSEYNKGPIEQTMFVR